jgi:enoyl-CoA hydratase/carnithine racemase
MLGTLDQAVRENQEFNVMDASPDSEEAVRVVVIDGKRGARFAGAGLHCTDLGEVTATRLGLLAQPVLARASGACRDALAVLQACDIVVCAEDTTFEEDGQVVGAQTALRNGWVTLCVPADQLKAQTDALARELANKDALVLRFTKETLRRVPTVPWDEVLAFTAATQAQIKALQADKPSPRASAIASFLAGKSKPGAVQPSCLAPGAGA